MIMCAAGLMEVIFSFFTPLSKRKARHLSSNAKLWQAGVWLLYPCSFCNKLCRLFGLHLRSFESFKIVESAEELARYEFNRRG